MSTGFAVVIIVKTYFSKTYGHSTNSVEVSLPGNKTEKIVGDCEWQMLAVRALNSLGECVDLRKFHDNWNDELYFVSYGHKVRRRKDL